MGTPFIKNFEKNEYKGGTQNWDIIQNQQDVIYFANNNGLVRFDGTDWTCTNLPNRTILRSLAIDDNGKIYAGGQNEFGYFFPNEKGITTYFSLKELIPKEHQQFEDVWDIVIFQSCIFFRSSNKIFILKDNSFDVFDDNSPLTFLGKANDELFIHSSRDGLKKFDGNTFNTFSNGNDLKGKELKDVIYRPDIGIMIATFKSGIYILNDNTIQPWQNPQQDFFKQNRLNAILNVNGSKIAFGTMLGGVVIMDNNFKSLWKLDKKNGLQNNNVLALYEDTAGQLWMGYDNGIGYMQTNKPLTYLIPDGELEGTAYTAAVHDDKLYLGTTNGLYYKDWKDYYDPFGAIDFQLVENTKGQVWGLNVVNDELLMGHNDGAFIIKNGTAKEIYNDIGTWMFLPVSDSEKNKVISGGYYGINLLEKQNSKWKLTKRLEGLNESSRILANAPNGNIWMAHPYRGIYKIVLNNAKDEIESTHFYGKENGLPSDVLNHVFLVFNKILVASERGIFFYNENKDQFEPFDEFNNLFVKDEAIQRLFEDASGNVWFVGNQEVGYLKVTDNGIKKDVEKIIIPELKGKMVGGFELIFPYDEKSIFIGTDKGFIHYDVSNHHSHHSSKLKVVLSKVELLTQKDSLLFEGLFADGSKTSFVQNENALFDFSKNENAFRFKFSATEYANPELVTYQYFLKNADKDWSDWSNKTEKEYNNLRHGKYEFQVRAKKGNNQISEIMSYRFSISPPWYASTLAFGIYSLLFASLLLGLILVPRRQYQKETEQLISEHQQVVEETEQEISNLKNEKLRTEIEHQNQTLASTTMHLVQKKEMLNRMKEELKKISKGKEHKDRKEIDRIIRMINQDAHMDDDWEQFSLYFDKVHSDFLKKISSKFPSLTPKDKKLCAYLRMNLSTKEIAPLMNISIRGVEISRYRLRKKLELPTGENLVAFLMNV